jgi:RNA polymerase sigma-70 factor (ECF subfamily)
LISGALQCSQRNRRTGCHKLGAPAFTIEHVAENVDRALIDALRSGSREAFSKIYAAERERLYGFLVRLCRDRHVAADLFQNTWLKLARNARSLREDTDVRAWLFTVARNEFRSHRRAQTLDLSRFLAIDRERASVSETAGTRETGPTLEMLEAALSKLGDADRELLLLVAVDGLELRQAAAVLGISYEALRQRLSRARQRLTERIAELSEVPVGVTCPK